jgi:ADP-heptose:LPS heptosyltransferase
MGSQSKNIVVLRFSAMGDVALMAPVLRSFLKEFPDHKITLATRPKFSVFFQGQDRFTCFPADVDKVYSGLIGIFRLFLALRKSNPDMIIDLHDHIRTRFICFLFRLAGTPIIRFKKGRQEKKLLTKRNDKIRSPLPHTVGRYQEAFTRAGFTFSLLPSPYFIISQEARDQSDRWLQLNKLEKKETWYGLAPFAAHKSKIWPLENYADLIRSIKIKKSAKFFLFGGGQKEIEFFNQLKNEFPNDCVIVAGQLKLQEELALMKNLDQMICVDSSNMHLAALLGIPTITIWGGTHPDAGFAPFGNKAGWKFQISMDELPCRPCSVYGTDTCHRGDFACLNRIKVEDISTKILQ